MKCWAAYDANSGVSLNKRPREHTACMAGKRSEVLAGIFICTHYGAVYEVSYTRLAATDHD